MAIVGGGINGCAVSELLSANGYKVIVIDKNDFGSGATSRSARILHCGLRHMAPDKSVWEYLWRPKAALTKILNAHDMARGQVELVRTIPSRIRNVDLAIPIYRGGGYSGWHVDWGARLIRLFNRDEVPMNYRRWRDLSASPHPFVKDLPNPERIESVCAVNDMQFFWPERIALDAVLNAQDMGAILCNFTEVRALRQTQSGGWQISLEDVDTPAMKAEIRAKLVLNLTGAWVDEVAGLVSAPGNAQRKVIGVKGVHLMIRLPERYRGAGLVGVNREHEPFFCLPLGKFHYIGPTETVYNGDLDDIAADEDDIEFILEEAGRLLPQVSLKREDVVMTWAGARPITYDKNLPKGRRLPYGVIHNYAAEGLRNILAVTWGIIVTHRKTARALLSEVAKRVAPSKGKSSVASFERSYPKSTTPLLQDGSPYTVDHVRYAVTSEHARDLRGVLFGRWGIGWSGRLEKNVVDEVAAAMAGLLRWNEQERDKHIKSFEAYLERYHSYKLTDTTVASSTVGFPRVERVSGG